MQIRELSKPVTAKALNESMAKKFGYKLNLEQFTDAQLEDVRNKMRTEMSQFEVNESFDTLHTNPKYQKTRALLDVINVHIAERAERAEMDESAKCCCEEKGKAKCPVHGKVEEAQDDSKAEKKAELHKKVKAAQMKEKAMEHSVPAAWINSALSRIELGEADDEELAAELTTRYDLSESTASYIVRLAEGEETKAEVILATKDMVDRITGWIEDVAAMKAEQLLELLDSIRESLGSDVAQQYQEQVKPALEAIYTALESSRQGLSTGLATVSGGNAPTMGAAAPTPELGAPDLGTPELPGAEEPGMEGEPDLSSTPPAPEIGREKRESVDYSRRLGILLASKKN